MTQYVDIAIIGAGIAGLGASQAAQKADRQHMIFESRQAAGGLLDCFYVKNFRFDQAVHLSFAKEHEVRKIFDQTEYYTHPSESYNFDDGLWLKHPVQNNLYPLPPMLKTELVKSYFERGKLSNQNYDSWLRSQYGNLIAERYPLKYTKKYWDTDARELSTNWIGQRVRQSDPSELLYGAFTNDTPNTYYTSEMRYPKIGGFRAFLDPIVKEANILYNAKIASIDPHKKEVLVSSGETVAFNTLVSSIPLPEIVKLTKGVPEKVVEAAKSLAATSIDLISVGIKGQHINDLWFYIYDEDILASRAYSPSVKSPDNVPKGFSSLQFEVYSRGQTSKYTQEELITNTRYALEKMKICDVEDIEFIDHRRIKYGNVIFDNGMEYNRNIIHHYYEGLSIHNIGRFGEWDYLWSHQSFMSGLQVFENDSL